MKCAQTVERLEDLQPGQVFIYEEDEKKMGVFKDSDGTTHHLELTCTHLGCDLGWNDADKTWDCPCHGSRFQANGAVRSGPATQPLKKIDA